MARSDARSLRELLRVPPGSKVRNVAVAEILADTIDDLKPRYPPAVETGARS